MAQKLAPHVEPPRRFYKVVTTKPAEGGVGVRLDGRLVKSPAGNALVLPTQALADLIAAEWDAQATHIVVALMPATRLAFTAIDFIGAAREATAAEIGRYAGSDGLCYFADAPSGLVERQAQGWVPVLDWAEQDLGLHLVRVTGIQHQEQPAATLLTAARMAQEESDFGLAALAHATALFGSAVLAFALARGKLGGEAAHDLARLEEAYQQQQWGVDEEAAERTANMLVEARMLDRWFQALRVS